MRLAGARPREGAGNGASFALMLTVSSERPRLARASVGMCVLKLSQGYIVVILRGAGLGSLLRLASQH